MVEQWNKPEKSNENQSAQMQSQLPKEKGK